MVLMPNKTDAFGRHYIDAENIRITFIPAKAELNGGNASGAVILRIQAYVSDGSRGLHPGADLPLASTDAFKMFVDSLCGLYAERTATGTVAGSPAPFPSTARL